MVNTKPFIRRTIIASAVAALAGGAFAATAPAAGNSPWESAPEGLAAQTGTIEWSAVKDENLFKLASGTDALLSVQDEKTFTGKLWVVGSGKDTQASGIWASGGEAKAVNAGSIYVTAEGDGKSWSQHAMGAANGAEAVNEGTIVARNAYGMFIGTETNGKAPATIRNNGVIYVETQGAAMELGGVSGSTAINAGRIEAGKPADEAINGMKFTYGVLINTAGNTFTNKGAINAGEASSAIEVKDNGNQTTINLEAGSSVAGVVHIDASISGTVLNANGFKGTLDLDNDSAEDNALTINVKDGADLTLADGFSNKISKVEITDGTFTTSIWQTATVDAEAEENAFDNAINSVTVNAGGVFNVKALNSGGKTKDEPTKPHDTLLFMGTDVVLNGGALQVDGANYTGSIKVGTASAAGSFDIQSGSYSYESVSVAKQGSVNVAGDLAVGTLSFSDNAKNNKGKLTVAEGGSIDVSKSLTVGNGATMLVNGTLSLAEDAKLNVATKDALTVSGGTLEVWNGQAFTENALSSSLANTKFDKAFVEIQNDVAMTTEELKKAQALFKESGANLAYANLELKLTDAEKENGVAFDTSFGTAMIGQTVTTKKPGADGKATAEVGNATVGVGTIRVAEGTKTLTLTGENGTTYFSGSEELFDGAQLEAVTIEGAAVLGQTAEASGDVNVKDFKAKDLTVVGRYSAQNVTTENAANIEGAFKVQSINGAGATVKENGVLEVSSVNAKVTVNDGGLFVLGEPVPAAAEPAPALFRAAAAAPAPQKTAQINSEVKIASGGAFAFDEAAGRVLLSRINDGAYGDNIKSGFLVDASVTLGEDGKVQIGDITSDVSNNTIAAGKDVVTIVDASKFGEKDVVFDAATVKLSGKNLLENASRAQTLILTSGEFEGEKFALANAFLEGTTTKKEQVGTLLTVGLKANDSLKTDAATYGALESIVNSTKAGKLQQLVGAIGESAEAGFFNEEGALTAQGAQAVTEAATLPVTAGLYNAAYDAAREVTGAVERRHLTPSTGLGLWADVFYAKNEAKSLYGANGYSGSVTGGTLGVDGEMPCGAKAGVALSVGTADADSEKTIGRYSTDSDFWGVTLYAGRDIGGLAFSADVSYLAFENDLQGAVAGASVKESVDATVFTAGLRADMTVWESAGKGFAVVPHAGLRYTKIDADDAFGFKSDSLDVFEAPIGVKVAGRFEPTAGWQVSPSFDFTAVPQLGDKTVGTIAGDVNVLDNVYNATLGVSAAKDAFTFGLSYRYGFGTDDRADQVIQARVGYAF